MRALRLAAFAVVAIGLCTASAVSLVADTPTPIAAIDADFDLVACPAPAAIEVCTAERSAPIAGTVRLRGTLAASYEHFLPPRKGNSGAPPVRPGGHRLTLPT